MFQCQWADVCCGSCFSLMCSVLEVVCTFVRILHFRSHHSLLWLLHVRGLMIIVTAVIPLFSICLQGSFFFFLRKNSHILLFLCLGETCSFILGKGSALKVTYVVKIKVSFCTLAARNLGALPLSAAGGEVAVQ